MANSSPAKIRLATAVVTYKEEVSDFEENRFCTGNSAVDLMENRLIVGVWAKWEWVNVLKEWEKRDWAGAMVPGL
jgi:hypothetical protein